MQFLHRADWPPHAFHYLGGGKSSSPSPAQQIQQAPVPTPAPPVTSTNSEVIQAEQDVARQNLLKKSIKKTTFAGDTGGFNPNATLKMPHGGKF